MQFIIIDDEDITLFISKKIIGETLGLTDLKTFSNGATALQFLQERFINHPYQPAIILLDLNMPVISGWDFLELFGEIKEELRKNVHVYVVSSSIDPRDKNKALSDPNVISYITKPLTKDIVRNYFFNDNFLVAG